MTWWILGALAGSAIISAAKRLKRGAKQIESWELVQLLKERA